MASNYYGNLIWTAHALQRLRDRQCSQDLALKTFHSPDRISNGKKWGTQEYKKTSGSHTITLIATKNQDNDWVVLSAWVDPPFPGSTDIQKKQRYQQYRRAGPWGKLWMHALKQLFGRQF